MENHTNGEVRQPLLTDYDLNERCPVMRAVRALEGKWKLYIIYHLIGGTMRFGELRRAIPGVTQQMLTNHLRELEADGIVSRKVFPEVPPKVEYSLTPLGLELRTVTDGLTAWGLKLVARA
jgi:DNA-binding HxlR family transcriptional regulator